MRNEEHSLIEFFPILLEVIESGGEFRLSPKGTSMLPLLRAGKDSVALVSPHDLRRGDICLYRRTDDSFVLHRLMKFEADGNPVFCGDNQLYFERGIQKENIVAKVAAIYKKECRMEATSLKYRLYVKIWCFMPLRRFVFLPRRIANLLKRKK